MKMHRRTTAGLKLLIMFIAACTFLFSPVCARAQQSETESLLNASHAIAWGYFLTPENIWFISATTGTTHALSFNRNGLTSWLAIANEQAVGALDFVNKNVSLSANTAVLTPSDKYVAISVFDATRQSEVGDTANQWAKLIAGKPYDIIWYYFQVASTKTWYIVAVNGPSTVYRVKLDQPANNLSFVPPLDGSLVPVDTSSWSREFFQENNVWKVRFSPGEFLSFPLPTGYPDGAYTTKQTLVSGITSVLDHNMATVYSDLDGIIQSWTGEFFRETTSHPRGKEACYERENQEAWSPILNRLYAGTGGCTSGGAPNNKGGALNYEAHPGYDYVAQCTVDKTNKCISDTGKPVQAAAKGKVVNLNGGCVPKGISSCANLGAIGIDHGNGYITQYLHLDRSTFAVSPNTEVQEGQFIAKTGDTGAAGPHLHFEVLRLRSGANKDYQPASYATVDPYGFVGQQQNDNLANSPGKAPNICLWKGGCRFQ